MLMDYKARRDVLVKELQELTNRVLQYQGAIAMLDEILAKEAQELGGNNASDGSTATKTEASSELLDPPADGRPMD